MSWRRPLWITKRSSLGVCTLKKIILMIQNEHHVYVKYDLLINILAIYKQLYLLVRSWFQYTVNTIFHKMMNWTDRNCFNLLYISLHRCNNVPSDNKSALLQVKVYLRAGNKWLSESTMIQVVRRIHTTRLKCGNRIYYHIRNGCDVTNSLANTIKRMSVVEYCCTNSLQPPIDTEYKII